MKKILINYELIVFVNPIKIKLIPDKRLFLMFLAINAAGYDYENNPNGEHKVRVKFRQKAIMLLKNEPEFEKLIEIIKSTQMTKDEYIRLVNLVMLPQVNDDSIYRKINNQFNKIINSKKIDKLYKEYSTAIKKIKDYNGGNINRELNKVLKFFNLDRKISLNINIYLNLLDSYSRGTNYFTNQKQTISTSLDLMGNVNWQTVRHEFMHILLKKVFKDDLKNFGLKLPVNKNYSKDTLRVKFEENFILSANLFFLDKQKYRENNLKYFYDNGYKKIYKFYSIIEKFFINNKLKLNSNNLHKFLSKI